ncbi:polysaccharide biosynthesis tyrosine autokinase [Nitrospirillum sp. BR 11164]|uniref:GumC family protein n=1 Tax=Nitrospirillum sp. BR 11164 TaxID=3104324 RepID=UPI002B003BFF|nr:polysaccharide biosynthesis tyrosine autokinase [Nitrospirillum sp. BR 11164]MEA1652690.1 polysaccharide biosynthesis tyrosine autokinase [Nitrospirillum sp. BR 11164]
MTLPEQPRALGGGPILPRRLTAAPPAPRPVYMPPPQQQQRDVLDTYRKIWAHRRLVLACTVGTALLAGIVGWSMPSRYTSESRVLVGVPQPSLEGIGPTMASMTFNAERVQSEGLVAQSRELAQKVVDRLHLNDDPEFNPDAKTAAPQIPAWARLLPTSVAEWLTKPKAKPPETPEQQARTAAMINNRTVDILLSKLDIATVGRSDVLKISATTRDPETASLVANAVADAYLAEQRDVKVGTASRVEEYMESRIADLRKQVDDSERAIEDYRKQYGLYDQQNGTGIMGQRLTELNTQLITAQTAKADAEAHLNDAQNLMRQGITGDSVPEVLNNPLIQSLKQQQAAAEQRLAQLSATYGDKHPQVTDAKAQIADAQRKIKAEMQGIINGLQNVARTANARYQAVLRDFNEAKGSLGSDNQNAIHLEAMERDAAVNRHLLETMLTEEKRLIGRQQLEAPDARVISRATPPVSASYPPKALILLLGTLVGAVAGMLIALLMEEADQTFRQSSQIESATGIPVVALVPEVKGKSPTAQVLREPVSPFAETLRKIHIALELSEMEYSPRTVLLSSAAPGEGKSVIIAALGRLLASHGRRILIVDCDWRSPSQHKLFNVSNKHGLASLLTDDSVVLDDCIHHDTLSGLELITAGHWTSKDTRMLTSDRMRVLLQTFAKNYDLVLIDTAPVLVGAEVLAMSRMVDKVLFTVRWDHTRRNAALQALRQLVEVQCDLTGVIMSRVDPRRYRQYGYGPLNYDYARPLADHFG